MMLRMCQPRNASSYSTHSRGGALFSCAALVVSLTAFSACTDPSSSRKSGSEGASSNSPARLLLGATQAQALEGSTSSFVLESTPDLVLHATLRDAKYDGKTLLIRGTDPQGAVIWSYPHMQKGTGTAFDAVLPVFGSPAARKHMTGRYSFEVLAPDRTVIAAASASFTSTRGGDSGAFHNATPGDAIVAARKE